ncbi:MAG: type I glyceraldehyde-3-phosphate dehydrogenase [Candidatus Pacebacteria bacterium]|nr:type I glyceraldehyde-3-phosphate dehydrogenase [Candidatus Paceibacterota bacterium]
MPIKIAINGFGRIGRSLFKILLDKHPEIEVVAINDLTNNETLAHLLKYDSVYRTYNRKIIPLKDGISVDDKEFLVFSETDPSNLPWEKLEVDIVFECTGHFNSLEGSNKHIASGAKQVIISAPSKDSEIPSYILGVNEDKFDQKKDKIVDMGSCTTNCLAPVSKIINDALVIKKGFMTTVHSYTNDQKILDLPHKDLRRARAAALNIIPTSTGAAKAISKVIPELYGRIDGIALRVPTPIVSLLDLFVETEKKTTKEELIRLFKNAENNLKGIFSVEEAPLVSTDYIGNPNSAIIDIPSLMVNENIIKVVAWYDNEYAYACRLSEFGEYVGKKIKK